MSRGLDRWKDMQKQGLFRGIAKRAAAAERKAAARHVSDAKFRENIARDCQRRQVARWEAIAAGRDPDDVTA